MHKPKWFMMTLVGKDRPGIVAHITSALYEGGCNLGEASMTRLAGNLSIILMVEYSDTWHALEELVAGVAESMDLHLHVDSIEAHLHQHLEPDVRITVCGADRVGIMAKVTAALAEAGLHITDLQADMGGTDDQPSYALQIEGHAMEGIHAVESALAIIREDAGFEVSMTPISTGPDQTG